MSFPKNNSNTYVARRWLPNGTTSATNGNLLIARDAGGWASAAMVDEVYGHVDVHDPLFDAALRTVWGERG